jgi:hypothetical protein
MKKVAMALLVFGAAAAVASGPAWGQDKKVEFSVNAGVMTFYGSGFDVSGLGFTLSPQVDIRVAKGFMISPEFMFLTDSSFSGVIGLPGVIFNYVGKGFFIGGGAVLPVSISESAGVGELLPKINIGYRGGHINFTVYTITAFNGFFKYGLAGASLGYRF